MRTEMLIRMEDGSLETKGHAGAKAMKVAAAMQGVESVTLSGKDKSLLRVIGDGVDCNHLTTRLRRKVGHADVVELRTLHGSSYSGYGASGSRTGTGSVLSVSRDAAAAYGSGGSSSYYGYNYPTTVAAAAPDYYYGQQQHQPSFHQYSYPPPQYAAVHYEHYPSATDPNGCSIM